MDMFAKGGMLNSVTIQQMDELTAKDTPGLLPVDRSHRKGSGSKSTNRLTFVQKLRVSNYLESQKGLFEQSQPTKEKVADDLTAVMGFAVSPANVGTIAKEIGMSIFVRKKVEAAVPVDKELLVVMTKIAAEVAALQQRVATIEQRGVNHAASVFADNDDSYLLG